MLVTFPGWLEPVMLQLALKEKNKSLQIKLQLSNGQMFWNRIDRNTIRTVQTRISMTVDGLHSLILQYLQSQDSIQHNCRLSFVPLEIMKEISHAIIDDNKLPLPISFPYSPSRSFSFGMKETFDSFSSYKKKDDKDKNKDEGDKVAKDAEEEENDEEGEEDDDDDEEEEEDGPDIDEEENDVKLQSETSTHGIIFVIRHNHHNIVVNLFPKCHSILSQGGCVEERRREKKKDQVKSVKNSELEVSLANDGRDEFMYEVYIPPYLKIIGVHHKVMCQKTFIVDCLTKFSRERIIPGSYIIGVNGQSWRKRHIIDHCTRNELWSSVKRQSSVNGYRIQYGIHPIAYQRGYHCRFRFHIHISDDILTNDLINQMQLPFINYSIFKRPFLSSVIQQEILCKNTTKYKNVKCELYACVFSHQNDKSKKKGNGKEKSTFSSLKSNHMDVDVLAFIPISPIHSILQYYQRELNIDIPTDILHLIQKHCHCEMIEENTLLQILNSLKNNIITVNLNGFNYNSANMYYNMHQFSEHTRQQMQNGTLQISCIRSIKNIRNRFINAGFDPEFHVPMDGDEVASGIYLVKGKDQQRKAWYYVSVDPARTEVFKTNLKASAINLAHHGYIICSAFGDEPPQKQKEQLEQDYFIFNDDRLFCTDQSLL